MPQLPRRLLLSSAWLLATTSTSLAISREKLEVNKKNIKERYDTGEPWTTLKDGKEFQPAKNLSPLAQEHLRRLTQGDGSYTDDTTAENYMGEGPYSKIFVDGAETYYDEYAQAWRAVGWYIDCDYCDYYYGCWWDNNNDGHKDGQKHDGNNDDDALRNTGCRRFLLWAAVRNFGRMNQWMAPNQGIARFSPTFFSLLTVHR